MVIHEVKKIKGNIVINEETPHRQKSFSPSRQRNAQLADKVGTH